MHVCACRRTRTYLQRAHISTGLQWCFYEREAVSGHLYISLVLRVKSEEKQAENLLSFAKSTPFYKIHCRSQKLLPFTKSTPFYKIYCHVQNLLSYRIYSHLGYLLQLTTSTPTFKIYSHLQKTQETILRIYPVPLFNVLWSLKPHHCGIKD